MPRTAEWSSEPPSWALPVTVPGTLVMIRERGMLAYIGPVCAYQAGFSFSLAVSLNPDGAGEPGEKFSAQDSAGRMPAPQVSVGFDDVVMDSTAVESWQFTPGPPACRRACWPGHGCAISQPGELDRGAVRRWALPGG